MNIIKTSIIPGYTPNFSSFKMHSYLSTNTRIDTIACVVDTCTSKSGH